MFTPVRQAWRFLVRRDRLEADVKHEMEFHLEQEISQRVSGGMTRHEARRTALRDFGGVARVTEEIRDARGVTLWNSLIQDVRFAFRTLKRAPGYTAAAILILGLGIGANTAIFSVVNGVLLKPLPFRNGSELVLIQQSAPLVNVANARVSIQELFEFRKRLQSVRDLVEYHSMTFTLLNQGEPDEVATGVVSANFFEMLGVKPVLGRSFRQGDDALGSDAVLILSYEYWQQKFGGDPSVINRVLQMNNRPHTIVGVLPVFPQYPQRNDIYMPTSACPFRASAQADPAAGFRAFASLQVFGRLTPGASEAQATSEIAAVSASFSEDHPDDYLRSKTLTGRAALLQDQLVVAAKPMLWALGGATLLVLLIACANVANLAITRTVRRSRELAVRTALGASRTRLFRQLVTESVVVAVAGGLLGLAFASLTLRLLVAFMSRFTERADQIQIDNGVLWFALTTAIVTGIVFGSAPALAARGSLSRSIRDGGAQAGEAAGRHRLRSALVVAQVGVSFVLVLGAALLLESVYRLSQVPLGFDTRHVVTAQIDGNFSRLPSTEERIQFQSDVLTRLRASSGVTAAAVTASVPLSNIQPGQQSVTIERPSGLDNHSFVVDPNIAGEGYFETLNVPVIAGRSFAESDTRDAPLVAVINTSMAKLWEGASPLGSRFRPEPPRPAGAPEPPWLTVIGIVGDFHLYTADRDNEPQDYTPFRQAAPGSNPGGRLLVRTDGLLSDLFPVIKAAVHGVDAQIPVEQLESVEELRTGQLSSPALTAALLTTFAAVALAITLAGIVGVIGTTVNQRTREFGLRIALGASRLSVLRLVLGQGTVLVAMGLALGLCGAYGFSRLISRFLFGTTPTDAGAYLLVATLFAVTAFAACFGPARRATSIDPLKALRSE